MRVAAIAAGGDEGAYPPAQVYNLYPGTKTPKKAKTAESNMKEIRTYEKKICIHIYIQTYIYFKEYLHWAS